MPRSPVLLLVPSCLLSLLACVSEGPGEGNDDDTTTVPHLGEAEFHVSHYQLDLELPSREAEALLTVEVDSPGDCLTLDFHGAPLTVSLNGEGARGVLADGQTLSACDPSELGWEEGRTLSLTASWILEEETWSPSQVGFSVTPDSNGEEVSYLLSWVGQCGRLLPCEATPSSFSTWTFRVRAPGQKVLCPGELSSEGDETTCEFPWEGGPAYSTLGILASSGWEEVALGDWNGIRAVLWDVPGSGTGDDLDADIAAGFLEFMEDTFGPYPYGEELRFVVAPTWWAGFEHPGNIALAEGLAGGLGYPYPLMHTTLHEIVHQWAGDLTTLADTYDFVWKEAMAEYLSFVYEDQSVGEDVSSRTSGNWKSYSEGAEFYLVPEEEPPLQDYYGDVYGPGPLILFRQMEGLFSREQVLAGLQQVLGSQRSLSIPELQAALEDSTGAELSLYFERWVYGSGAPSWPEIEVNLTPAGEGMQTVETLQSNADGLTRPCAFHVRLTGDGGESLDVPVSFPVDGSAAAPQEVAVDFPVTGVEIDPFHEALVQDGSGIGLTGSPRRNPWLAEEARRW